VRRTRIAVLLVVVAFLGVFLAYPLYYSCRGAFVVDGRFTLGFFEYLWQDRLTAKSILNSLALGCVVTAITAALALPLSVVGVRYRFPGKAFLTGLLLLPMIMPPFVGAIGMRQILARFGSLNLLLMRAGLMDSPIDWLGGARFWGVVIMEVLHLYPIMYLNFAAALANVDPSLEEAAVNMGSSGLGLFRKITLPLMMPGLFAGSVIVFIWAFTDLGTPLVFGYRRVVPVQIFNQVTDLEKNPQGYALVVGVLAMTMLIYLASKRLFGLRAYQSLSRGPVQGSEKRTGPLGAALAIAFILIVVGAACLPHAAVLLTSLKDRWFMTVLPGSYTAEHFRDALGHELTVSSIRNSIRGNSIHSNGGKGISLVDGGNEELAPPTVESVGSVFGTACPDCTIDVYSDDEDEGEVYEGSTTADGDGNWSLPGTPEGPNITATATDSDGNTSEFSAPLTPPWPTPSPTPTPTPTPSPTPSPTPGATRTLMWGPGWHNASWSGASTPEEAFACAAGNYAAAYRLVGGGWERHFPDRPELSNMGPLNEYDAFLILVTAPVTCDMPIGAVTPAPSPTPTVTPTPMARPSARRSSPVRTTPPGTPACMNRLPSAIRSGRTSTATGSRTSMSPASKV